jgi:hypothetical protein
VASAVIKIAPDDGDRRVRTIRSSRVPKANSVINPTIRKLPTHVRGPQSTETWRTSTMSADAPVRPMRQSWKSGSGHICG